ncbi:hypothetical protein N657DRAFT_583939 [Parathielavia appendiculata]|uniref:Uncharacterized protein n=1 Tax=Parathielavia appendiculata TaxID=2587402 RepID=A0AAN6TQ56_9PEZI|nr:hypothetical protein N657DRAFT_583939 [Parathielavia appendiculata]
MNFEFIDNNGTIDRALRKQIRSHVAKGRNAGKKVNRPSRRNLQRPSKTITTETQSTRIQTVLTQPQTRPSTSSLPLVTLPWYPGHWEHDANAAKGSVPLILRAISFFSEMRHPRELDSALDYVTESHTIWVQPMFVDEAYFHGAMAVFMAAFPNLLAPTVSSVDKDSLTARVRHNCLALRMINSRLSGRDAFTDETLIVVLVLGLYERYQGEYHRGLVHLNGVQRILELRGGLRSLVKTRPDLARKIFR